MRPCTAWLLALAGACAPVCATPPPPAPSVIIAELLRDPSAAEWRALARFDGSLTRSEFESRLGTIFDPGGGLRPYLRTSPGEVSVYGDPGRRGPPVAVIRFAGTDSGRRAVARSYRTPSLFKGKAPGRLPLEGLRVAIEPADIGGSWAKLEDRSVYFRGYGLINEGDLNLVVARLLRERLTRLGASVFLVRDRAEPVVALRPSDVEAEAGSLLRERPYLFQDAYRHRVQFAPQGSDRLRIAADILLTKALETRARADLLRRSFQPDLTLVLQHNATAESAEGRLTPFNRNIFFVNGAYVPSELAEPEQRFRLLTKLLEDVTPAEVRVAAAISRRFEAATGYPPVLYGNSATTRLVEPGNPYVVARNLAFNREHDGPVVVTEPYFMNQRETLERLLAGDYPGRRRVAGAVRESIFREYADCVASGVLDAYTGP